jgi:hypothetical protein
MHWACDLDNGIPFDVYVDHHAVIYLVTAPAITANRKIMTYILNIHGFQFNIYFKKGKIHLDADALSRLLRFQDSVDELSVPPPHFGKIEDDDLRLLLEKQATDPSTLKKVSELIKKHVQRF